METCPIHDKILICPTCIAIERGRRGGKRRGETHISKPKKQLKRDIVCTAKDCLRVFESEPLVAFNSTQLRLKLPEAKQKTTRTIISGRFGYLLRLGKIERLEDGKYRLISSHSSM